MKIGFIGLGIMGRPMALNLIKGGIRSPSGRGVPNPCSPARRRGARPSARPMPRPAMSW